MAAVKDVNRARDIMGKVIMYLQDSRYLYSIRHGFTQVMPIMIIGSIAVLINNLPVDGYQRLMVQIWGEGWRSFGAIIYNATFSIVSLVVTLAISHELANWYRSNRNADVRPLLAQIVSFASVMITLNYVGGEQIDLAISGANGLFLSIVITVLATEIFIQLSLFYAKYTSEVYTNEAGTSVSAAIKAIPPAIATVTLFAIVRLLFNFYMISDISAAMNRFMQIPFLNMENNLLGALIFSFVSHSLWIFGIHGNNVLDNVARSIYLPAIDANVTAVAAGLSAPYMYTKTFFDAFVYMGGAGTTLCLIIAIFLFARRGGVKRLARISTPMGIFNINEPLLYGLPIVLNPMYIIPFLCTPLVMTLTSSAAMALGLVPYTVASIEWTIPVFASGYAATGGAISGILLQAFNLLVGVCIYLPFVRLSDRLEQKRFKKALAHLSDHSSKVHLEPAKRLVGIEGPIGVAARQLANDLCSLLRSGAPQDELRLVYQPLIDTKVGRVFGYETLLRWEHPMHGNVSPMVTVSLAEDMEEMEALGLWILDSGLGQLAQFRQNGLTDLIHFTNLSVRQLSIPDFTEKLEKLLIKHDIPPRLLQLEITESAILSLNATVHQSIKKLNQLGVRIALDDFSMGHSSLGYLGVFPANIIKIEESLVENIEDVDGAKFNMVCSIVSMCESLGIAPIAEHVETKEQMVLLQKIGCTKIQGYFFSKPLAAEEFEQYIKRAVFPPLD